MASKAHNAKQANEAAQKERTVRPVRQGPAALALQAEPLILQRAVTNPRLARPADMLALQRAYGNRAVTHLIQTKLMVGPAGDKYEREADRVAEQVMNMPAPAGNQRSAVGGQPPVQRQAEEEEEVQTKPLAASITPLVQRQAEEEEEVQTKPLVQRQAGEEEEVQTKPLLNPEGGFAASPGLERRLAAHKGSGSPLPEEVRADMETRFGADLSGVRVHAGGEAVQMNKELSAQAFTHGQDIYFGAGKYNPHSETGKLLLAHELTHSLQQGAERRIARWGLTVHPMISRIAFQNKFSRQFSLDAIQFVSGKTGLQDLRATPITGIVWGTIKGKIMKGISKAMSLESQKALFKANEFHYRPANELPNHGEAGAYKVAGKSGENEARVKQHLDLAAKWVNGGDIRAGLVKLADALHSAEDRGSHGEGDPGTGHDPRCKIPPAQAPGGENPWFRSTKWNCDDPGMNHAGAVKALDKASEALSYFLGKLTPSAKFDVRDFKKGWFSGIRSVARGVAHAFGYGTKTTA
jgi:hypothetical protein